VSRLGRSSEGLSAKNNPRKPDEVKQCAHITALTTLRCFVAFVQLFRWSQLSLPLTDSMAASGTDAAAAATSDAVGTAPSVAAISPPVDHARLSLRGMWQLPAAWRVLRLLAGPLSHVPPSPGTLEDALLEPPAHIPLIANLHGRLLGLSAGKSSEARWISSTSRFARSFPGTFGPILGFASATLAAIGDGAESDDAGSARAPSVDEDDPAARVPAVFRTMDEYAALSPSVRLMLLYAIAELVICENDTLLRTGTIADIEPEDMRLAPVGVDAVGSHYWYFGDEERLYREPDLRVVRAREQRTARAAEKKTKIEKEKVAEADRIAKEQVRLERLRQRKEKWAPRVASSRSTRAAARLSISGGVKAKDEGSNYVEDINGDAIAGDNASDLDDDESAENDDEVYLDGDEDNDADDAVGESYGLNRRRSGRVRKPVLTEPFVTESERPARSSVRKRSAPEPFVVSESLVRRKRQRNDATLEEFSDPLLRTCTEWELVCSGPEELTNFIVRFGSLDEIASAPERSLVHILTNDLHPILEEASAKIKREEERRFKAEFFANNQKKSSRVSVLEQRRLDQESAAAAKLAEEAERDRAAVERAEWMNGHVKRLEKVMVRELRLARHMLKYADPFSLAATMQCAAFAASQSSASREDRARRRMKTDRDAAIAATATEARNFEIADAAAVNDATDALALSDTLVGSGATHIGEEERAVVNVGSAVTSDDTPVDAVETRCDALTSPADVNLNATASAVVAMSVANGGVSVMQGIEPASAIVATFDGNTEKSDSRSAVPPTSTAVFETDIPHSMRGTEFSEDKTPTFSLTQFVFLNRADCSNADLSPFNDEAESEDLNSSSLSPGAVAKPDVFGLGIVLPPSGSDQPPVRVELGRVHEWIIDYSDGGRLWVRTNAAWYELGHELQDYSKAFEPVRRKFEICVRLSILSVGMRSDQLDYGHVVNLLSMRYVHMRGYKEAEFAAEAPFILSQMETGRKSMLKSGFLKQLRVNYRESVKQHERTKKEEIRARERANLAKIRAQQREFDKARHAADRATAVAERVRLAEERKKRRQESSATRSAGGKPVSSTVPLSSTDKPVTASRTPAASPATASAEPFMHDPTSITPMPAGTNTANSNSAAEEEAAPAASMPVTTTVSAIHVASQPLTSGVAAAAVHAVPVSVSCSTMVAANSAAPESMSIAPPGSAMCSANLDSAGDPLPATRTTQHVALAVQPTASVPMNGLAERKEVTDVPIKMPLSSSSLPAKELPSQAIVAPASTGSATDGVISKGSPAIVADKLPSGKTADLKPKGVSNGIVMGAANG
jgi:Cytosine specific DNA methyltransferase replication foci domain